MINSKEKLKEQLPKPLKEQSKEPSKVVFSRLLFILSAIYITLLLVSNIIGSKLILLNGTVLAGAVIIFPFIYIFGDIFTEVYGLKKAKIIIWMGFICSAIMSICFMLAIAMPYPSEWQNQDAFVSVLATTPRLCIASLLGFLVGGYTNAIIMSKLKSLTNEKYLALRTILSTIAGEALDTLIFISIAFIGTVGNVTLFQMIIAQAIMKILIEVVFTPLTYIAIAKIKRKEALYE